MDDSRPDNTSSSTDTDDSSTKVEHPLQRAHQFFQKAVPVVRDVKAEIDRQGGIEKVSETVVERVQEVARRAEDAVAKATAIEGEVIVRTREPEASAEAPGTPGPTSGTAIPSSEPRERHIGRWIACGIVAAAATYGALRLQRR